MKNLYIYSIILLVIGLSMVAAFYIIGSSVAEDGTIQEQFWLLPIGYLLTLAGLITVIVKMNQRRY